MIDIVRIFPNLVLRENHLMIHSLLIFPGRRSTIEQVPFFQENFLQHGPDKEIVNMHVPTFCTLPATYLDSLAPTAAR